MAPPMTAQQITFAFLAAIGALVILKHALDFLTLLYKTLIRPGKNLKKAYGEWAVVTGATDGIGKAMAFEFARKGQNVLFIGRSADKLKAATTECAEKYPKVTVKSAVIDFVRSPSATQHISWQFACVRAAARTHALCAPPQLTPLRHAHRWCAGHLLGCGRKEPVRDTGRLGRRRAR